MSQISEVTSLLELNGWTVECESPLEIRHDETGSYATMLAAEAVVAELRAVANEDLEPLLPAALTQKGAFEELTKLHSQVRHYAGAAVAVGRTGELSSEVSEAWETAYHLVFSDAVSRRVAALLANLNNPLKSLPPAVSHEDDILAYEQALTRQLIVLGRFFA